MSNSKISLVIDYLLKNKTLILVKGTISKGRNELIEETITSLILYKIDELKISLSNVSEIKISLTKNKGTKKERENSVTINATDIEGLIGTETLSKYIGDSVYHALKFLSSKPTVAIEK